MSKARHKHKRAPLKDYKRVYTLLPNIAIAKDDKREYRLHATKGFRSSAIRD